MGIPVEVPGLDSVIPEIPDGRMVVVESGPDPAKSFFIPGMARIGPMLVTGFAGQMTILSAAATAIRTSRVGLALLAPTYLTRITSALPLR